MVALNTLAMASNRPSQNHQGPIARLIKSYTQATLPDSSNSAGPIATATILFSNQEQSIVDNPISSCTQISNVGIPPTNPIATSSNISEKADAPRAQSSCQELEKPKETKLISHTSSPPP